MVMHEGRQGINGLPWRMISYPIQFSRMPYYKHLQNVHLFNMMHIRKNVLEILRWILDGSDKEKIVKNCSDIKESKHAMRSVVHENSDGDQNVSVLPWLLTEQWSNVLKEVIRKIKFPTGFYSNINNILTKKVEFGGVKNHVWHTLIKVIILVYIFLYWYTLTFFCFLSTLGINNDFFVIVCSTSISPRQLWQ